MKRVEKIYWALAFLSVIVVMGFYYWELRYLLADNPGRNELLMGSALMLLYSWPIWVGFPASALVAHKILSKTKITLSFLPLVLLFAPSLFRELNNAL